MMPQELRVTALILPSGLSPSFAIPLCERDGCFFMQVIGKNHRIQQFVEVVLDDQPRVVSTDVSLRVGGIALYAFAESPSRCELGDYSEMCSFLDTYIYDLDEYPFLLLDIAEFLPIEMRRKVLVLAERAARNLPAALSESWRLSRSGVSEPETESVGIYDWQSCSIVWEDCIPLWSKLLAASAEYRAVYKALWGGRRWGVSGFNQIADSWIVHCDAEPGEIMKVSLSRFDSRASRQMEKRYDAITVGQDV